MEKQKVTITVITEGEKCEMSDGEIKEWYRANVSKLFNPEYGTPEISVALERCEK
ncbi:MAG: hypothetical protein IKN38_00960 [Clostridia bacterium]|nr:hypothetical protein [Clostridia bacterium]